MRQGSKPLSFTITQLAAEFGMTTRAIRFYEDQGLLAPRRVGSSAAPRRVYGARERVRIRLILRGKRLGMSLAEIKELFDLYDADKTERAQLAKFLQILDARRGILVQQRDDIAATLIEIEDVARECKRLLSDKPAKQA
jgi:DNA-binding transcriptional MerR regulator